MPGLAGRPDGRRHPAPGGRHRDRLGAADRVARAGGARASDGGPDRRPHHLAPTAGAFWRWPALRLNQVNWYARMYSAAAAVGGDRGDLHDAAAQAAARASSTARTSRWRRRDLEPRRRRYRFHYLPRRHEDHKYNLDSAEYANIVCGLLVAYQQARGAGMPALDSAPRRGRPRVVRARAVRLLDARRLPELGHRPGLQALAPGQEARALAGRAARDGGAATSSRRHGAVGQAHARPLVRALRPLDRASHGPAAGERLRRAVDRRQRVLGACSPPRACRPTPPRPRSSALGAKRSEEPPPLYAYDPDVGRLAVTTPAYNTAIVAVNRGAFPYGGVELARLFDGRQDVAGGVGGRPPASFGLVVRNARDDRRRLPARVTATTRR